MCSSMYTTLYLGCSTLERCDTFAQSQHSYCYSTGRSTSHPSSLGHLESTQSGIHIYIT